jgi:hypothetical protein
MKKHTFSNKLKSDVYTLLICNFCVYKCVCVCTRASMCVFTASTDNVITCITILSCSPYRDAWVHSATFAVFSSVERA